LGLLSLVFVSSSFVIQTRNEDDGNFLPDVLFQGKNPRIYTLGGKLKGITGPKCKIDPAWTEIVREVAMDTGPGFGFAQLVAKNVKRSCGSTIKGTETLLRIRLCKHSGITHESVMWDLDLAVGDLKGSAYTDACKSIEGAAPTEWVCAWGYLMEVSAISNS
jgi:hypothetical protein